MTNCSPDGTRYSYFSFNELADWCNEDLFYGSQARDLSYEGALGQLKEEAQEAYAGYLEQAHIAAAEVDHGMGQEDRSKFFEKWFDDHDVELDEEAFVDRYIERNAHNIQIDEPTIEGELDGVSYRISWLGGSPGIFVLRGPLGYAGYLCGPCVPGAASGGTGFVLESEVTEHDPEGYLCYCVPRDWLRDFSVTYKI